MRFCTCPLRVESIFPSPVGLLKLSPTGLQSQMFWGLYFPVLDPHAGESVVGLQTLTFWGEPLWYNFSLVCGLPTPRGNGIWLYCQSAPPTHLVVGPYVFCCRRSFLIGFSLFHWWLFCRQLRFWSPHDRRWAQGLSTPPFWPLQAVDFWLAHVTWFCQQNVGRSNTVPILGKRLKRVQGSFLFLLWSF